MIIAPSIYSPFKAVTCRSATMDLNQESALKKYTLSSSFWGSRHQFGDQNFGILEQSYLISISFQQ